jgi:hypothetical protein
LCAAWASTPGALELPVNHDPGPEELAETGRASAEVPTEGGGKHSKGKTYEERLSDQPTETQQKILGPARYSYGEAVGYR